MHNSELITPQHLTRKAVIYIRQATPHQVLSHQDSLRLQYALGERAHQLGWPDEAIEIIDDDLGLTAATAHHRPGFNTLVAQVTLEQVRLILSYDVTRLSRNCSDWYPLLDLCGYKGCLIADGDGIYDPATVNGRLLLGLKGTLSEWERHTMKARLTAGLLHKAQRGNLAPPGRTLLISDVSDVFPTAASYLQVYQRELWHSLCPIPVSSSSWRASSARTIPPPLDRLQLVIDHAVTRNV
jgi:DNA invertase Pin-like site-specific DNA recombinase